MSTKPNNSKIAFNPDALKELLDLEQESGDAELISSIVNDYRTNSVSLIEKIDSGLRDKNLDQVENAAHSLKSSSALLGLDRLAMKCYEIETDASDKISTAAIAIEELKSEHKIALEALLRFRNL